MESKTWKTRHGKQDMESKTQKTIVKRKEAYVLKPLKTDETAVRYTYMDFEKLDDKNKYEIIDGVLFMMSPGASNKHQYISGNLFGLLWMFLRGKPCKVFHPPSDVCLNAAGDNDTTVVQPDIFVVCDSSKLDGKRCNGAPDLVIEILSPSTTRHDRMIKFNKYLETGVREYWIIDPETKTVSVHVLENGKYVIDVYGEDGIVPVRVLDGCRINMPEVFDI